jgi:hypothetical protein
MRYRCGSSPEVTSGGGGAVAQRRISAVRKRGQNAIDEGEAPERFARTRPTPLFATLQKSGCSAFGTSESLLL